jgi:hypothetical protein
MFQDQARTNAQALISAVETSKPEMTERLTKALQIAKHMTNGGSYSGSDRTLVFVALKNLAN